MSDDEFLMLVETTRNRLEEIGRECRRRVDLLPVPNSYLWLTRAGRDAQGSEYVMGRLLEEMGWREKQTFPPGPSLTPGEPGGAGLS